MKKGRDRGSPSGRHGQIPKHIKMSQQVDLLGEVHTFLSTRRHENRQLSNLLIIINLGEVMQEPSENQPFSRDQLVEAVENTAI